MRFEFATATRIVFGAGKVHEAVSAAVSIGGRALIVSGSTPARLDPFINELAARNVEYTRFAISGEPTIPAILDGVQIAKDAECKLTIGCGGGSVLDGTKRSRRL